MNIYEIIANQYREELEYAGKGGVVIIYNGEIQGWVNELRDPETWRPGCIAVDESGKCWETVGGNDSHGAEHWEQLQG